MFGVLDILLRGRTASRANPPAPTISLPRSSLTRADVSQMDQQFADILADRARCTDPDKYGDREKHQHHNDAEGGALKRGGGQTGREQDHRHGHDRLGAQSVGIELAEGPIDWAMFTSWLKSFLEKEGEELIWRLKGVLWTTAAPGHGSGAATTWGWGAGRRTVIQVKATLQ